MKKSVCILAVILAALLLLSGTAFAADENPIVTPADGNTTVAFQTGYEKLDVTYQNEKIVAGGLYMVFVVTADGNGNYIPTESSVLYINQVVAPAAGTVIFNDVYPSKIANSAIMISGTGLTGPVTVAMIDVPTPLYTSGDVDKDGDITSADAVALNKYLAGLTPLEGIQYLAADIDEDGDVTSADAVLLNKYLAGLINEF